MPWTQRNVTLPAHERGFHLITREIMAELPELARISVGLLHVFIQHTSASLTINENADPDVPKDLVKALRAMIPDVHFEHGEGNSDAHLLSMMIGCSLNWPYRGGELILGTWQGVYFIELDGPRRRKLTVYVNE